MPFGSSDQFEEHHFQLQKGKVLARAFSAVAVEYDEAAFGRFFPHTSEDLVGGRAPSLRNEVTCGRPLNLRVGLDAIGIPSNISALRQLANVAQTRSFL